MKNGTNLTTGSIPKHIIRMLPFMTFGMFSIMAFNLTDTWFVSLLGTKQLAAMGFSFPIVMLLHSINMGIGIGTSASVSKAIGEKNNRLVKLLTTNSLILGFIINFILSFAGWIFIPDILNIMNATPDTLNLATKYMRALFIFTPLVSLPMIGNHAIRATGDTKRPAIIMTTASLLNVILDPLMIFGIGPFPAMGLEGAAYATGITRMLTVIWALWVMHSQKNLITLSLKGWNTTIKLWKKILHIGMPAAGTNILMPITMGFITKLTAGYGEKAIAATAAGQRIEMFLYILPISTASILVPIIGQNWGAKKINRIKKAWTTSVLLSTFYSVILFTASLLFANPIALLFSKDPEVVIIIVKYLKIMFAASAFMHISMQTAFSFNGMHKPIKAAILTFIRMIILTLPLAYIGSYFFEIMGIFYGIAIALVLCGIISIVWFLKVINSYKKDIS